MAEILITGMDLSEDRQIIITKDGKVLATDWRGISMPTEANARQLQPHGRLVDIDKMELDFKATVVNCIEKDPNRADQYKEAERLVLGILKRTHNVLPASEGE